jgi:phage recombination protein Bet
MAEKKETTALARKENTKLDTPLVQKLTQEQKELIKRQYAKYATDDELAIYYNFCEKAGVDPMRGQSHFIKYNATAKPIMMIGIDGFQARATSDPRYEGMVANAVYENDNFSMNPVEGIITHSFGVKDRGKIAGAYAILKRKGMIPAIQWILFSEYNSPAKDNWKNMPEVMITKVARATLLRREYPDNFSGVYVPEEFGMEITEEGEMKGAIDITPKETTIQPKVVKPEASPIVEHAKRIEDEETEEPEPETQELKVIPNDPLPSTKKPRGRPKAEASQHYNPETQDNPHESEPQAEPEQVKEATEKPPKTEDGLQLAPSVIEKMKNALTPREAFEIMVKYAFQGQGHHVKALVREFCPEYFERGYSTTQIPETALIAIVKKASGLVLKSVEKTHKCKSKGCKNQLTEADENAQCWECRAKEPED